MTKAAVASRTNRIPRKQPLADPFIGENDENITPLNMEVDLLRKQSIQDKQKVRTLGLALKAYARLMLPIVY